MTSNFGGLGILFYPVLFLTLVVITVLVPLKKRTDDLKPKKVFIIMPFALLLLTIAAYFLNFGWIRLIFTYLPIIPVHAILFLSSSFYSADLASESRTTLVFTIINYITYPLGYILLPDGSDYGGAYMFFGLIKNEAIIEIAWYVALFLLVASFLLLFTQFFVSGLLKHKRKKAVE